MNKTDGLVWARRILPRQLPKGKHTQTQLDGLKYERAVIGAIADALTAAEVPFDLCHNPWFEYEGAMGKGVCIPDALLAVHKGEYAGKTIVLEVKRTYVPQAIDKLMNLYCPVVHKCFGEAAVPMVICKHSAPGAPRAMPTFFGALQYGESFEDGFAILQWLGAGKLNLGVSALVEHRPEVTTISALR